MNRGHALAAALVGIAVLGGESQATQCEARSGPARAALVELYTSEGCSSCPPADRWLSELPRDGSVVPLAFHVDYWDYIGWRDPYASPVWSRRQREEVARQGGRVVFTPQVIVNGRTLHDWGSEASFRRKAAGHAERKPVARIALVMEAGAGGRGTVSVTGSAGTPGAEVFLAVFDNGLESEVTRGENAGRRLRHDHVVRELIGPLPVRPDGAFAHTRAWGESSIVRPGRTGIAAFVRDPGNGEILQALSLLSCGV